MARSALSRRLAAIALGLFAVASARPISAQCTTITSPPTHIVLPSQLPNPQVWALGFSDHIVVTENGQKLFVPANYGFGVYSLANPGTPQLLGWVDLLQTLGPIPDDGPSYISRLGASEDGQRVLISITGPGSPRGDTLVAEPGEASTRSPATSTRRSSRGESASSRSPGGRSLTESTRLRTSFTPPT